MRESGDVILGEWFGRIPVPPVLSRLTIIDHAQVGVQAVRRGHVAEVRSGMVSAGVESFMCKLIKEHAAKLLTDLMRTVASNGIWKAVRMY